MALALFRSNRPPSDVTETAEVDVTPVMNMFIILIPFLVSMAVFTQVSIIEFSVPPNVSAGLDQSLGKPRLKLTVRLGHDYLGVVLGDRLLDSLHVNDGVFPFDSLSSVLPSRRREAGITDEVVVASLDRIAFKHVVRVMDICRESGFTKVGLSSATEDPGDAR